MIRAKHVVATYKTPQPGVAALPRTPFPPGNGLARAVHLTTAAVSCVRGHPVDLGVLRWYQKQAGLVGVLPIPGRGLCFYAEDFTSAGVKEVRGACQKTESSLASSAPGLSTTIDLRMLWRDQNSARTRF